MYVINSLAPVFFIVALGFILRRTGFLSSELLAGTNRLVYWVGLPCLLFYKVATADINLTQHGDTWVVVIGGMLISVGLGYLLAALLGLAPRQKGTFIQAGFRGNLAFIGLPVVVYSSAGANDPSATIAVLVLAGAVPIYNAASVWVLLASHHRFGAHAFYRIFRGLITNPLIIGCVAGGVYAWTDLRLAPALGRTFESIGQMALPLALLGIGGTLRLGHVRSNLRDVTLAALIKVAAAPLAGILLGWLLALSGPEWRVAMTFLACPTAAASYVMADQMGGDGQLAAAAVALSTLLSILSLSLVIAWT